MNDICALRKVARASFRNPMPRKDLWCLGVNKATIRGAGALENSWVVTPADGMKGPVVWQKMQIAGLERKVSWPRVGPRGLA